jgi:hypothetical protein
LRELALFMDCDLVAEHAACLAATVQLTRDVPFEDWVFLRIDRAVNDLLLYDLACYRNGETH